ncbi:MAG: DsbA family protein [Acidobacteriota bacterium]
MNTSFDPLSSSAPGIAYFDLKSPYAYLAAIETLEMEERLGLRLQWRPLTLDIPSYLGSAKLGPDGKVQEAERSEEQWRWVKHAYFDCRRYAALHGVTIRGTVKIWDTRAAHVAMQWAERSGPEVVRKFLLQSAEPFWRRELDAEMVPVLLEQLEGAGAATQGFEEYLNGPGGERHDVEQAAIFDAGLYGVPSFVVGEEVWFGREHLPRIEWLLAGRSGPAPDIGYRLPAAARGMTGFSGTPVVALDVTQPESYLLFVSLSGLFERLGVSARWRPFAAWPAARAGDSERSRRHMERRRREREKQLATAAQTRGVRLDPVTFRGARAHHFLLQADDAGCGKEAAEALFRAGWEERLDLDDEAVLRSVAETAGLPTPKPVADALLDDERARQAESGVVDAAGVLLGSEFFQGRQHVELLEARLTQTRPNEGG